MPEAPKEDQLELWSEDAMVSVEEPKKFFTIQARFVSKSLTHTISDLLARGLQFGIGLNRAKQFRSLYIYF